MIKNQCPICKKEFCFCQCDHPVALKAKTAYLIEIAMGDKERIERALRESAFGGEFLAQKYGERK